MAPNEALFWALFPLCVGEYSQLIAANKKSFFGF
jgi:hypothetical protein